MADGELTVKLNEAMRLRLHERAVATGLSVEQYAADLISDHFSYPGCAEDNRRYDEYVRTGEYVTLERAMEVFEADLETKLAERAKLNAAE